MAFYGDPPPHDSTILLIMLRASADQRQTLDSVRPMMLNASCVDDELNDVSVKDDHHLTRRLRDALNQLLRAGLVTQQDNGFLATGRGRELLGQSPLGIDGSVLMRFAEYRHYIKQLKAVTETHPMREDRAERQGMFAHNHGARPTENPYEPQTLEYDAWQQGWYQAQTDEVREREIYRDSAIAAE